MVRIVVCSGRDELARLLFDGVREVLRRERIGGELTCSADPRRLAVQVAGEPGRFGVLVLDAGDRDCLALARQLRRRDLTATVLFVADPRGCDLRPLLYCRPSGLITAPGDSRQLTAAVRAACAEQYRARPYFTVKNKDALLRVDFRDIRYFESRQRVVVMHALRQDVTFYAKLADVQARLPQDTFLRCHQSYLVNLEKVRELDRTARCFRMASGETIEISKSCYAEAVARFEEILGGK